MRIYNNQDDYKDSTGLYNVQFSTSESMGSFTVQILTPLFETLKDKIKAASATILKNMTCYTGGQSDATCTNFFNYIKAMLTLYIMLYGRGIILARHGADKPTRFSNQSDKNCNCCRTHERENI